MTQPSRHLEELVDWVNVDGSVKEVVTRQRMRAETLRHRATYVAVIDGAHRLVVHQRAHWKEVYPSWWDLAFGGVCGAGEPWDLSAERELGEEAGIFGQPLTPLGGLVYDGDESLVVGRAYLLRWDGPIQFNDGEVVASDKIPFAELDDWLKDRLVCPDSLTGLLPLLRDLDL